MVWIVDSNADAAEALSAEIRTEGGNADFRTVELTDPHAIRRFVAGLSENGGLLDVLCNIAGLMWRRSLLELSTEDWDLPFKVYVLCLCVVPYVPGCNPCHASSGGRRNREHCFALGIHPAPGHIAYNTSKTAVVAFSAILTRDDTPGRIRMNWIAPGEVRTPMLKSNLARIGRSIDDLNDPVPYDRIGEPEETATVVAFLASDEAGYPCGSVVEITGSQEDAQKENAMQWTRTFQLVDVHCAGEIGRVLTGGVLDISGETMADKLDHINKVDDSLRRLLCSEPRSGPAGSVVLLVPATAPEADTGFIVLQPDQAHAMSGSNAMCAVTAILETGMKEMVEPETEIVLDTAAGLVRAVAQCENGKVNKVALDMPPAFVMTKDAVIETPAWGQIACDICFGGVFYALVDVDQFGLKISPEHARGLAMAGVALRDMIAMENQIKHPTTPALDGLAYVMFRSEDNDGAVRTCTTLRPGRVDRSPCGTGSNANMAVRHASGIAKLGDLIVSRSIIGSEFITEFVSETKIGTYVATQNRVSGQCWIYGISQVGLDPSDPFPFGFTLSDTWGE